MKLLEDASPEVKEIIRAWIRIQVERYGPNWKSILAKEMAETTKDKLKRNLI